MYAEGTRISVSRFNFSRTCTTDSDLIRHGDSSLDALLRPNPWKGSEKKGVATNEKPLTSSGISSHSKEPANIPCKPSERDEDYSRYKDIPANYTSSSRPQADLHFHFAEATCCFWSRYDDQGPSNTRRPDTGDHHVVT